MKTMEITKPWQIQVIEEHLQKETFLEILKKNKQTHNS
jgi:hypothetical protein